MDSDFQYCADHLRNHDYGRYISCLFLQPQLRHAAFAIYAFHNKICQIPALISDPMPGEIRIQWWMDVIKNTAAPPGDPVANALRDVIVKYLLPIEVFERLLQAHIFDIYHDPMSDTEALKTYLGETFSSVFLLLSMVADKINEKTSGHAELPVSSLNADACGHGGVFCGAVDLLKALPLHEHQKQSYFPPELSTHERVAEFSDPDIANNINGLWLDDIRNYALVHHQAANEAVFQLPTHTRILFSPMALAKLELERMVRQGIRMDNIYNPPSRLAVMWCLWKATRTLAKNSVN